MKRCRYISFITPIILNNKSGNKEEEREGREGRGGEGGRGSCVLYASACLTRSLVSCFDALSLSLSPILSSLLPPFNYLWLVFAAYVSVCMKVTAFICIFCAFISVHSHSHAHARREHARAPDAREKEVRAQRHAPTLCTSIHTRCYKCTHQ